MSELRASSERKAQRVARWLGERSGRVAVRFEQVEPGDEQVRPDGEQRELDALPSRLAVAER